MKKVFSGFFFVVFFVCGLTSCLAMLGLLAAGGENETPQTSAVSQPQPQPQPLPQSQPQESELEKFERLLIVDGEKLVVGSDNRITIESIEAAFQPKPINTISEISNTVLSESGRPYYFKIRSIYKGYDKTNKKVRLQDIGPSTNVNSNITDLAMGAVFGLNSSVYSVDVLGGDTIIATFPTEANSIADFYLIAVRITEPEAEKAILIRFVRNIQKPGFDPAKFIVRNGMHYITVDDAISPSRQDIMMHFFTDGATGYSSDDIFDPIVYPLVDLMDARVAMDKKDIRNDYTFPTVRVKYVSEVLFKRQSSTTITISTDDNVLTEMMTFTGRASAIKNGEKVRVYYTIAKDPLEKWEIQAIERL